MLIKKWTSYKSNTYERDFIHMDKWRQLRGGEARGHSTEYLQSVKAQLVKGMAHSHGHPPHPLLIQINSIYPPQHPSSL